MKPILILGLGNTLMGDDGAGVRVAELLSQDHYVTAVADVWIAGTDLLRSADRIDGRERVILVDAMQSQADAGRVSVLDEPLLEERTEYAHSLSAPQAVALMQAAMPSLTKTKFTWVLVHVTSVQVATPLSPEIEQAVPIVASLVKGLL